MPISTRALGILSLGLLLGCSNNDTNTPAGDMSMKLADLAVVLDLTAPPDLTVPPDMTVPPPDMTTIFNGCDDASFVDATAAGASRTVNFGVAGNSYSPKCLLIAKTQTVTFSGTFGTHPLRAGTVADQNAGSPGNPITLTMSGSSAQFVFNSVGTFPYICTIHGGGGMTGVVRVK